MYKNHAYCRACGYAKPVAQGIKSVQTENLIEVFDLGIQPLANDFSRDGEERSGYAPLKVLYCPRCSLAQLSVVVDPQILYRHYSYVTSPSDMMRQHFETLISDIEAETALKSVLEIGSNDGRLLELMKAKGFQVMGVDPAYNLAELARAKGVATQTGFFGEDLARVLPTFDIILARHVFCHADDWQDFVRGLEWVSNHEAIICIEVPYVGDTLEKGEFDQIYHEHLSFMSIKAMQSLLAGTSLHLHRLHRYTIHGGAMLFMLRHNGYCEAGDVKLSDDISANDWQRFSLKAKEQILKLTANVKSLTAQGKRVAGLGASAKSTVWINACGFTRQQIQFISDTTPQKQHTFSPGTDIPIIDEGAILRELPDYVILFAWNYQSEILEKFSPARSRGVKFIIPVPEIQIV